MNSNKKMNKGRYFKNGTNIYPYSSASDFLIRLMMWDVVGMLVLSGFRALLFLCAKLSYFFMTLFSANLSDMAVIRDMQLKSSSFFAGIYQRASTLDVVPWVGVLIKVFMVLAGGYIVTLALRRHNYELRPFRDDLLSRKIKRAVLKSYEIPLVESTSSDEDKSKHKNNSTEKERKNEEKVRNAIRQMKVSVKTRKEINGDDFKSICKIDIETPKGKKAKGLFKNTLKGFPEELTDATEGEFIFGQPLREKGGKTYFFIAEKDCTEFYAEKIQRSLARRLSRIKENKGLEKIQEAYTEENSSWSLDLLTDRSEEIEKSKLKAREEAKSIESQVDLYMSSNPEMSAQLDEVKVSNSFVSFRYSIPKGKKINYSSLAEDIENFAGVRKPTIENIQGKLTISVPLDNAVMLDAKELIHKAFDGRKLKPLEALFGGDADGNPVVFDIATAPHLLVSGTSGSGKSVGINQFILSIMKHATPKQVQFMMIDPKIVELSVYRDSPFLMANPVTEVKNMPKALGYLVLEQEDRYRAFEKLNVRNIEGYNRKMIKQGKEIMPEIFLIVDEMADMMMSASKEVENYIIRLGQKARAAGIHILLATQSPRADVVTGLIKANISTRVSYRVVSGLESSIILDEYGAEQLNGQGDTYIKWGSKRKIRVLSIYIDDDESVEIVKAIKEKYGETEKVNFVSIYDERKGELVDDGSDNSSGDDASFSFGNQLIDQPAVEQATPSFSLEGVKIANSEDAQTSEENRTEFENMAQNKEVALQKKREGQGVAKVSSQQMIQTQNALNEMAPASHKRSQDTVFGRMAPQNGELNVFRGKNMSATTSEPSSSFAKKSSLKSVPYNREARQVDVSNDEEIDVLMVGSEQVGNSLDFDNDLEQPTETSTTASVTQRQERTVAPKAAFSRDKAVEYIKKRPARPNRPKR